MRISVELESQLRIQAGVDRLQLELAEQATMADVLVALQQSCELVQLTGVLIFCNSQPVSSADVEATVLHDGDRVLLWPAISGG